MFSLPGNSVARFTTIIFLIFTSVCFLYLGVCIFTEWFSEKPDYLEDVVVRHLGFLSESNTYITSTFSSVASYVLNVISLCISACINYIRMCTNIIDEKASAYLKEDVQNFDYKLIVYWACQVVNSVVVILFALCSFAIGFFLVLLMCICLLFSYAVLISIYLFLFICIGSLFFLKTLLQTFLLR